VEGQKSCIGINKYLLIRWGDFADSSSISIPPSLEMINAMAADFWSITKET
jgi:hypothetical protein